MEELKQLTNEVLKALEHVSSRDLQRPIILASLEEAYTMGMHHYGDDGGYVG